MTCGKCNNKAIYVQNGHFVGNYWYCRNCKIEVDSTDNTPKIRALKQDDDKIDWALFKPFGNPFLNLSPPNKSGVSSVGCTKGSTCMVCGGIVKGVVPKVNDKLRCVRPDKQNRLAFGREYEIFQLTANGARFYVDYMKAGASVREILEFTLCRFETV